MAKIYSPGLACICALLLISKISAAQQINLQKGYYIVAAAYHENQKEFAERYSNELNKNGLQSKFGFDAIRKFYYVYLGNHSSFNESIREMLKVRNEGKFVKAWVRIIKENSYAEIFAQAVAKNEVSEGTRKSDQKTVSENNTATDLIQKQEPIGEEKSKTELEKVATEVVNNPPALPVYEPQTLRTTPVFLSLYNATTNEVLDGEVDVVDASTSKLIKRVKGNEYLNLPNPPNKTGDILLVGDVFGFRKEENQINFKNTEADTIKPNVILVGNFYMVNFPMIKIHKGDISTLYNVYFFNDAAVMLPTSQYQLNRLLQLLKENPSYKIMLHGHTNGGGGGKIIHMGKSRNYFAITKDVIQSSGSAKELSEARAKVIKEWLLDQGIADNRVDVKGWGGSRMIHDKNGVHARKNIRVDVEVTDE